VLSAPALTVGARRLLWRLIRFLGRRFPNRRITLPLKPEALAADPRVGQDYEADPNVNLEVTLGLVGALVTEVMWTRSLLDTWSTRALVVHGLDDEIVKPEASEAIAASPLVDRRTYPGLRHEALNEPTGPAVVQDIIDWIDAELASRSVD
jgi:alpha-beta hydrolase superfamily lysophospholipase